MRIKILAALFLGTISSTLLHAQEQVTDASLPTVQDTLITANVDRTTPINTAFSKTTKQVTTGAITVLNPVDLLRYDNVHNVNDLINGRIPGSFGGTDLRG